MVSKKGINYFIFQTLSFFVLFLSLLPLSEKRSEAGDYHTGSSLICSQCHVIHYSVTHEAHSGGIQDYMGSSGPYQKLLRFQVNDLCLFCHDGKDGEPYGFPDVLESKSRNITRQSGMLNKLSSTAPYEHWKGHTLGSTATAPGGTFSNSNGLTCIDCHMPHGDVPSQYRNLWISSNPGDKFYNKLITYATGMNDTGKDVFQKTASEFKEEPVCKQCHTLRGSSSKRYDMTDISFNEPDQTKSAYGAWCKSCHTNMHGSGGDSNMGGQSGGDTGTPWKRHPVADVNIGANSNAHSSYAKWSTGWDSNKRVQTLSYSGNYPNADNTPSCMSCHRGHGSVNPFGLIYTNSDGTLAIESIGTGASLTKTCRQCHNQ